MSAQTPGQPAGGDVHVDWHMTPAEWTQLRGVLLKNTGYEYIGRLEAGGALEAANPAQPEPELACRVCDGSGNLTVPDADGESASEQACPDPIHDQPVPPGDVHVDWHMTPQEWGALSVVLGQHADTPYIARLIEAGKIPAPPDVSTRALAYAEDREADEIAAEDAEPQPAPELAAAMARAEELRAALDSLTDRAEAGGIITEDEAREYGQLVGPAETLRERLDVIEERIGNLAAGLKLSASSSQPSKKSEIEMSVHRALLALLDPR